jgi:transcriptional regulator with XRE-family HTH domain
MTQEQVAQATGVQQSTVQRLLASRPKRYTRALRAVCKYAKISLLSRAPREDPAKNQQLISALRHVWDGSPAHADALAQVIKSLAGLSRSKL